MVTPSTSTNCATHSNASVAAPRLPSPGIFGFGLGPLDQPAHEGGLADVLEVVADHAHQPHAERHRRVPGLVHHAVEVRVGQLADVPDGLPVDRVVVAGQQVAGSDPDGGDLAGAVPV